MILLHYTDPGWPGFKREEPTPKMVAELMGKIQELILCTKRELAEAGHRTDNLQWSVHYFLGVHENGDLMDEANVNVEMIAWHSVPEIELVVNRGDSASAKHVIASGSAHIPKGDWTAEILAEQGHRAVKELIKSLDRYNKTSLAEAR